MPIENFFAIFLSMFVLALAPGPAMLAVISRSITSGARQGIYMSIGIVLADYIFISITLLGLSMALSTFEPAFNVIKYLGSAYLLFLGCKYLLKTQVEVSSQRDITVSSHSSFLAGLFITLGNPKAILFYASVFPGLLDPKAIEISNVLLIFIIASAVFGGVNIFYAFMAERTKNAATNQRARSFMNKIAGVTLILIAIVIF